MTNDAEGPPPDKFRDRPVLVMVTSHWVSMLGLFLVGTALITWMFVLPLHGRTRVPNPYIGIVVFVAVPLILLAGLAFVPLGIYLGRRRVRAHLAVAIVDRKLALRRLGLFLGLTALINVIVGTQITYQAVERMESVQFCGQACHAMAPEWKSHMVSPHARVACVECHVGEGARGWLESKMAGTRQLAEVAFDNYPRPVPPALESGRLIPSRETCEQCHWPEKFAAARLRVISKFAEDESNSPTQTVLMMMVGGSRTGGIHGKHFKPGVEIRFAAADARRQKIPWVEYKDTNTGETHVYLSGDSSADSTASLPRLAMQCVDCHNRPTHAFALPERELDTAFAGGWLPTTLPFLKKKGLEVLKATYTTSEDAAQRIPAAIVDYYKQSHPEVYAARTVDVQRAGQYVAEIYGRNVFPDLNVSWGTYPNNIGHDAAPGCFRCHDDQHKSRDGKVITQDCSACHEAVAVEDAAPDVLKTLGLADRLAAIKKK
jgi:NapC/NirT cytochrome c family protein